MPSHRHGTDQPETLRTRPIQDDAAVGRTGRPRGLRPAERPAARGLKIVRRRRHRRRRHRQFRGTGPVQRMALAGYLGRGGQQGHLRRTRSGVPGPAGGRVVAAGRTSAPRNDGRRGSPRAGNPRGSEGVVPFDRVRGGHPQRYARVRAGRRGGREDVALGGGAGGEGAGIHRARSARRPQRHGRGAEGGDSGARGRHGGGRTGGPVHRIARAGAAAGRVRRRVPGGTGRVRRLFCGTRRGSGEDRRSSSLRGEGRRGSGESGRRAVGS
mmetsp:Transcript_31298/g.62022  ORF Transcript_31298/g.62022 Transcript_31298/m.62022 type:complete len:269 (+) Transcript_31298:171-977(+)